MKGGIDLEDEIEALKKRIEFNKTEPEVIIGLVKDATGKGEKIRKENAVIKKVAADLYNELSKREKIIFDENDVDSNLNFKDHCSFYTIGGVGGKWYAPYAIVRILFENGIDQEPEVDVYAAGIEEINEQEHINVDGEASRRMLIGETKALEDWGKKNRKSIIFIDGPIVDPPSYNKSEYLDYRCNAVKACLSRSKLVGCVKLSRDKFFIKKFEKMLGATGDIQKYFPSDQHLFSYFFTSYRFKKNYDGFLFSKVLDVSDNETFKFYKERGVHIYSIFFQNSLNSKILRLDIARGGKEENQHYFEEVVKAAADWQYPEQYIPVPVELAHEKCKIRQGAAETIYDEILTRSSAGDPEEIITMFQLR